MNMINQPVLVVTHLEKVVGFFYGFRRCFVIRALAVNQLSICIKALTPKAIKPLVFTEIDIPRIIDLLHNLFYQYHMGWIRRTDEITVFDIKLGPKISEKPAYFVNVGPGT